MPSLNISFPILLFCFNRMTTVRSYCEEKRKKATVRMAYRDLKPASVYKRILQTSPFREREGSVQSNFSASASSSCCPHILCTHKAHISLSRCLCVSLSTALFLCLITVCVLYPLSLAPRQLRHCSDGGGGCVFECVGDGEAERGSAGQKQREESKETERKREREREEVRIKS